jgi:hypothetical protein
MKNIFIALSLLLVLSACNENNKQREAKNQNETVVDKKMNEKVNEMQQKIDQYVKVKLTTDMSLLSENEKKMLPHLIKAVQYMDPAFWEQTYGDKNEILSKAKNDLEKQYIEINYGPWDRMQNNEAFINGVGEKFAGANFYPNDMTKEEFENADLPDKTSQYTLLRRNTEGKLYTIPYHIAFEKYMKAASDELLMASKYADNKMFKKYLELRAKALLDDDFLAGDMDCMDMKDNHIDIVIGPI